MSKDEERRVPEDGRDLPVDWGERDAAVKGAENGADDWEAAGTEDPAFYLKPSDKE